MGTMGKVIDFLINYWPIVLIALWFVVRMARALAEGNAKEVLQGLMLQAEKEAETLLLNTGQDKFDFVIESAYVLLPVWIRAFITRDQLIDLANKVYGRGKVNLLKSQIPAPVPIPQPPEPVVIVNSSGTIIDGGETPQIAPEPTE